MKLVFSVDGPAGASASVIEVSDVIVAGWAGRDRAKVDEHIAELAQLGVAPPSQVPLYYRVAANQLTQDTEVEILGPHSSGEAEVFYFSVGDEAYVSLASDHTDRRLEADSVAWSKQVCVKPVASQAWRLRDVEGHWDELILRSWIEEGGERVLYQEGTLAELLRPQELASALCASERLPQGSAMLCGTVPVRGGIRPSTVFAMALEDPRKGRRIAHRYVVKTLPMVA